MSDPAGIDCYRLFAGGSSRDCLRIEGLRDHFDVTRRCLLPRRPREVPIDFDTVTGRVRQIQRLADAVIRCAGECPLRVDTLECVTQRRSGWNAKRDVVQPGPGRISRWCVWPMVQDQ